MGVAAVVSSDCGAKDYVCVGKSGYIIDPGNVQQLIDAVLKITKDRDTAISMGMYDRERCRSILSEEAMSTKLRRIYSNLLEN